MNEQAQMFADLLLNDPEPVINTDTDEDQQAVDDAMADDVPWTFEDTAPPAPVNCPF